jgi:hypothetical protein
MGKYDGMTINERLLVSGKIQDFDKAIKLKDKILLRNILIEIEINDNSLIDNLMNQNSINKEKKWWFFWR